MSATSGSAAGASRAGVGAQQHKLKSGRSTAITIDDDDDAIENAVFQEKHGVDRAGDKDLQATTIDALLCCLRSRCLSLTCVLFPCLLLLFVALCLSSSRAATKRVLVILAAVPPGAYAACALLAVCLVCWRQIGVDTENAQTAHRYLTARSNLQKIAVTAGKGATEMTVAGRLALFLKSAKESHVLNFQWCLDNGQEVDEVDHLGRSALHWAALHGADEIVAILLRNGASVDLQDALEGLAPLHYAAYYGHVKATRLLVSAGATLTQQDRRKMNPLQLAELASLKLASVQPSHQMIIKFLRIAMKDEVTPPLQHTTGLTVTNLVERQMMALPQAE